METELCQIGQIAKDVSEGSGEPIGLQVEIGQIHQLGKLGGQLAQSVIAKLKVLDRNMIEEGGRKLSDSFMSPISNLFIFNGLKKEIKS